MRTTTHLLTLAAAALAFGSACTVKDVDAPALAGPSTFARSIVMTADRDALTQNGTDFTDIRITATGPTGQSESIALRAQVYVDGIAQDYGTLSTKNPITPTTIRYTAPAASPLAGGQVPQTISIRVTPASSGDFRGELSREIDLRLIPQGIILPTNPNLAANFAVTPASPQAFQTANFDASTSTNGGSACASACTYAWNFGDGTSASGITTSHEFRAVGIFAVTLTVSDARGAATQVTKSISVTAPTPPTASFTMSPTPAPANADVFFNASASRAAGPGRTIVSYNWNFGDGSTGSGVTASHRYAGNGTYSITLTVTDDAGASTQSTQTLTVGSPASNASASLTATPATGKPGQRVVLDASGSTPSTGATIVSYKFDYGDGTAPETTNNSLQSHVYGQAGTYVASVEVTDSRGKTATKTATVTITP